jgi:hypothetical protein
MHRNGAVSSRSMNSDSGRLFSSPRHRALSRRRNGPITGTGWLQNGFRNKASGIRRNRRASRADCARDHPFHQDKAYLKGLQWDGVERLKCWLSTYWVLKTRSTLGRRIALDDFGSCPDPAARSQGGLLPEPRCASILERPGGWRGLS